MEAAVITIAPFLNQVNKYILNPLILLVFAAAVLIFFFGMFQFIQSANDGAARSEGKKRMIYGLFGMFIMFSAYGLINLIVKTFDLPSPTYITNPAPQSI